MVITSPPYWALRDYEVDGQMGIEETFEEYVANLCGIFNEVRRVLKKEGTCWINLGDTYISKGESRHIGYAYPKNKKVGIQNCTEPSGLPQSIPEKCLAQIPARFAIEMTNRGWILRNEIVWHKPNCMPTSAKDRFTVDFEKLFFFVKRQQYYFEQQFEPFVQHSDVAYRSSLRKGKNYDAKLPYQANLPASFNPRGRNKRCVWTIPTRPCRQAHAAIFPPDLIETPILAGCPKYGIVLDPFMGSGTTAIVALKLSRRFIGIELNPDFVAMAHERTAPHLGCECTAA